MAFMGVGGGGEMGGGEGGGPAWLGSEDGEVGGGSSALDGNGCGEESGTAEPDMGRLGVGDDAAEPDAEGWEGRGGPDGPGAGNCESGGWAAELFLARW